MTQKGIQEEQGEPWDSSIERAVIKAKERPFKFALNKTDVVKMPPVSTYAMPLCF